MFNVFKRYVDEKYINFENGQIWFGRERIVLYISLYSVRDLFLNRVLYGGRYLATKFLVSRKESQIVLQQHGTPNKSLFASPIDTILQIMNLFGMGYAFRIVQSDAAMGFAVVTGVSSLGLEAKERGGSEETIDFVIGGLLAGAVQYFTKKPTYAVELSCVAQGSANECIWVIGSRKDILDYVKTSFSKKVDLAKAALDNIEAAEKQINSKASLKGMT